MQEHEIIEFESRAGRNDDSIVRRLYSVEIPAAFASDQAKYFDFVESCSQAMGLSVFDIKIAGSAQTGYSFHQQKPFSRGNSDLDVAVINKDYFEKLLRAAQGAALPDPDTLERPRRNVFPLSNGETVYTRFVENAALYGVIFPYHLPQCKEKDDIIRIGRALTRAHSELFKDINFAFYMSQYFFERKQRPNLGIYRRARQGE